MPAFKQIVDDAIVEGEPAVVGATNPLRQDAGPRDAEPVGLEPELLHQRDVFPVAVIVVARDVTVLAVPDFSGLRQNMSQTLGPLPSA